MPSEKMSVVTWPSVPPTSSQCAMQQDDQDFRTALRRGLVTPHYQPIVGLPTGRVVAVEALARWEDAVLGPVGPDVFVAAAERGGLILELGRQVLERACHDLAAWSAVPAGLRVNVNVSPLQLRDAGFVAMVADVLQRSGLAPHRLCLEITESAAVDDLRATDRRLDALRALGVKVALDDFGTGYSSLTVLRDLLVDVVKMDRTFVATMTSEPRDAVLAVSPLERARAGDPFTCTLLWGRAWGPGRAASTGST